MLCKVFKTKKKRSSDEWIVMGDVQLRQHTANGYHLEVDYCIWVAKINASHHPEEIVL